MKLWIIICLVVVGAWHIGEARAALVWQDNFTAASSTWIDRDGCPAERSANGWLCYSPANSWVGSRGRLRVRQSAGGERLYEGAQVSTYCHGYGWPVKCVNQAWDPPVRIEARIRFSDAPGFWQAFEAHSVDVAPQTEFDIAEMRGSKPRYQFCATHRDGVNVHLGTRLPFNATEAFHVYWLELTSTRATFGVDGVECGRSDLAVDAGRIGIDFTAKSANPSLFPWSGFGGPVVGTPSYAVDWVRAVKP